MTEAPAPAERPAAEPEREPGHAHRPWGARAAALGVLLLVALAVLALVVSGLVGADDRRTARPRATASAPHDPATVAPDRDQQQLDALTGVLAARRRAVLTHDRAAWVATIDPQATAFGAAQAAVFDHLAGVPFSDWSYQYVGRAPDLSPGRLRELGGEAWVARVLAGYRLRGFDTSTSYVEQDLTVVRRGARWFIASTSDGGTAPQPWDLGPVHVAHGEHVLVLGTAPTATLRQYAALGDRAVRQVSDVWGSRWSRTAVLVAPRSQHEFGRLLLREDTGLDQVAAVTTGDLGGDEGTTGRAGNDRVVINPAAFARLGSTGRRVVLTHEMTHVAVRQSTTSAVPIWLSEGFADFVAYSGTGVSRRVGAGDLLAEVRAGHGPSRLPSPDDFDPTRTTIAPSYSASWLACSLIADTYGPARLVALYRRAATAPADGSVPDPDHQLEAAFQQTLGTTTTAFTRDWLRYVDRLARS
ncbi:MAG TPA: hypothetical protein VHO27_06190 [Angustibacter sp.]|nr:hypothetical protein [Angustibacter sp.]